MRGRNADGILSSRRSIWKATATRHSRQPDWIAGLVGRLWAIWADPAAYPENEVFRRYFEHRLNRVSRRSGVRI